RAGASGYFQTGGLRSGAGIFLRKTNNEPLAATYESHSAKSASVNSWRKFPPINRKHTDRIAWAMIATCGVRKRGCTFARSEKKFPSRASAKAILEPLMATPFSVVVREITIAAETTTAADAPRNEARTASDIGDEDCATSNGGKAYCTAALTSI